MTKLEHQGWVIVGALSIALFLSMGTAFDAFGIFLVPLRQHLAGAAIDGYIKTMLVDMGRHNVRDRSVGRIEVQR